MIYAKDSDYSHVPTSVVTKRNKAIKQHEVFNTED